MSVPSKPISSFTRYSLYWFLSNLYILSDPKWMKLIIWSNWLLIYKMTYWCSFWLFLDNIDLSIHDLCWTTYALIKSWSNEVIMTRLTRTIGCDYLSIISFIITHMLSWLLDLILYRDIIISMIRNQVDSTIWFEDLKYNLWNCLDLLESLWDK